ncbi:ArsR/SmtB family transcription factor [Streptomyces sp. Da 82-17]|uniref:ArsR/SmtB family transcription factor n=1 Tax=Streptomyces sp. Da 82-17 TaxID=3377116 RepID=UPI0038D3DE34
MGLHGVERDGVVGVLKAVAEPTRFTVLWAVAQRERSVGELAELTGAHVAAVSQHLARLRTAGLVVSRRDGTRVYYRAAGDQVRTLLEDAVQVAEAVAEAEGEAKPARVRGRAEAERRSVRP